MPIIEEEELDVCIEYVEQVCELMKERATFIEDILNEGRYFFEDVSDTTKNVEKEMEGRHSYYYARAFS